MIEGVHVTYPPQAPLNTDPRYANAPAYAQPQTQGQGQGIVPPMPGLRDGGGNGGAASPKMRHLLGRTIIVEPVRVDETATDDTGKPRPEAHFHLTVVDGGPLRYGDNQDRDVSKQRPNTHEIDVPCRFTSINDYGFGFVQAVRDALAAGEVGRTGVVQQGTRGNKPYLITKCGVDVMGNKREDGDARYARAMEIFGLVWAAKHGGPPFISPEPRSLVAPPAAAAPQVTYQAPAQPAYAPAQAYAQPAAPAYPQYTPPQAAAPVVQPLPPEVEAWLASLPAEQQAGARTQYLAHATAQGAATAGHGGPGI